MNSYGGPNQDFVGQFLNTLPLDLRLAPERPVGAPQAIFRGALQLTKEQEDRLVEHCLRRIRERGDLPFVGLIGSKTKWATFRHRLEERGFTSAEIDHITCPIGIQGITGKEPEVIAIAVAAQLLQTNTHRSP